MIAIGIELIYVVRGTLSDLAAYYRTDPSRGEVVVLVAGRAAEPEVDSKPEAGLRAAELLQSGASARDVARQLAQELGISRNQAYQITQSLTRGEGNTK